MKVENENKLCLTENENGGVTKFTIDVPIIETGETVDMLVDYANAQEDIPIFVNLEVKKDRISVFYKESLVAEKIGCFKEIPNTKKPLVVSENEKDIKLTFNEDIILCESIVYTEDILAFAKELNYSDDKIEVLSKNNIPEKLFNKILNRNPDPTIEKPRTIYEDVEGGKYLIALIKMLKGGSVRLIGPASTGKNTFAETLCWLLGIKSIKFPGSPRTDRSDLIGDTELKTIIDSEGKTHVVTAFQERALLIAMREGHVLILDEINANQPDEMLVLHGPLDESRYLSLSSGETVRAHANFCCLATMNEGYEGVNILNTALCDRMLPIIFKDIANYGPILKRERPNVDDNVISLINNVASKLKILSKNRKISIADPCTIRGFVDVIDFIEYGVSYNEAIKVAVIDKFQIASDRKIAYESLEIC